MIISAYLAVAGLSDVGYRFYDAAESALGARVTSGISEGDGGWYSADATFPAGAASVRWNSTGTADAKAAEYFDPRLPNVGTGSAGAVVTAGTGTGQIDASSGVVKANTTQFGGSAVVHTLGKVWVLDGSGNAVAPASDSSAIKAKTDNLPPAFPANFADLTIAATSGLVNITQAAADKVWGTTTRILTAGTNIVLAKEVGLTGLNDIAAGAAMTLTSGERTAVANEVEAQIIDETDSEKVLQAITDKIASANPSLGDLTLGAISSAVWTNGTRRLTDGQGIVLTKGVGLMGLNDPTAAATAGAVRTELTTELGRVDLAISSRMATFVLPSHFALLLIDSDGKMTAGALPDPAPDGYGGSFEGEISGMTEEQAGQLEAIYQRTLAPGGMTVVSPVMSSGDVRIMRGDDYAAADGRALEFAQQAWPDLSLASVLFKFSDKALEAEVIAARRVRVEIARADTAEMTPQVYDYQIEATLSGSGRVVTLASGKLTLLRDL